MAQAGAVVHSGAMRADDSEELLAGYVSGPTAATEATALPRFSGRSGAPGFLRHHPAAARVAGQLRRFLGAGSQRKLRYARLLTEAIDPDRIPGPLAAVLAAVPER